MKVKLFLLLSILVLILCTKARADINIFDYYPLDQGNSWTYQTSGYDFEGNAYNYTEESKVNGTDFVPYSGTLYSGLKLYHGDENYDVINKGYNGMEMVAWHYKDTPEQEYSLFGALNSVQPESPLLWFPNTLDIGDSYTINVGGVNGYKEYAYDSNNNLLNTYNHSTTFTLESVGNISTEAGVFSDVLKLNSKEKIESIGSDDYSIWENDMYFAKGVGLVKDEGTETAYWNGDVLVRENSSELTSYNLVGALDDPKTLNNIFDNAVNAEVSGTGISAEFKPNFNLSLSEAAQLAGYDHFNWISIVTYDSILNDPTALPEELDQIRDQNGDLPTVPYVDPPHGGYAYQAEENGFPVKDNLDWFLDEEYTLTYVLGEKGINTVLDSMTIDIDGNGEKDVMWMWDYPAGSNMRFTTSLVGVRSDGTGDILDFLNTSFRWEYINGADQTKILRDNFDQNLVLGGQTELIEYVQTGKFTKQELAFYESRNIGVVGASAVPEPNTLMLLLYGLISMGIYSKKMKYQK